MVHGVFVVYYGRVLLTTKDQTASRACRFESPYTGRKSCSLNEAISYFLERAKSLCSAPSLLSQGKLDAKQRAASSHASFILSRTPSPPLWPVNRPKRGHYTRVGGVSNATRQERGQSPLEKKKKPQRRLPTSLWVGADTGGREKNSWFLISCGNSGVHGAFKCRDNFRR